MEDAYSAALEAAERVLDDVDRALARLDEGTYGTCETCGAPIVEQDLVDDPTVRNCEQHLPLD